MKAQVTSIAEQPSRYSGSPVFLITFKGEDGKSYRTWVDIQNGNFKRWAPIIQRTDKPMLDGLVIKKGNLIDADSFPVFI